ncbi:MAG TPA: hypothetical protein VJ483_06085 [Holophagaceae bacterium]|nr:hypothetical protein [Holophagaceae bacterium]
MILLIQAAEPAPAWAGDPDARVRLEASVDGALRSTAAFGPWPEGVWTIQLHEDAESFERATGAPPQRAAIWLGSTLHLRPWDQLRRRDLGALLRHELTHRRVAALKLRPWQEEARCLWAEAHTAAWSPEPVPPEERMQDRLDLALRQGTTKSQAWAYAFLRAWLHGESRPVAPTKGSGKPVLVRWPENRVPRILEIDGERLAWSRQAPSRHFEGSVRFGNGPFARLDGEVELRATPSGWSLLWHTDEAHWVAAASVGELGEDAPFEARRALASVVRRWLEGHARQHADGSLCPLTHCAVLRGSPSEETQRAADTAPRLGIAPRWTFFTGSTGGERLSPREVWGLGPGTATPSKAVQGDRWASWSRRLTGAQVAELKRRVKPGVRPGQKGMRLGASGPYAVESLRIACGRRFGWTLWPSNACEGELRKDGSLELHGHGWGHNVGLDLAETAEMASQGAKAEEILRAAFGAGAVD